MCAKSIIMCAYKTIVCIIYVKEVVFIVVFTSKQVAQALNVSEETVRRWIRTEELEAESLGKSYRIADANIRRFLKTRDVSYDLTMFPKLSILIETAMQAGLNPAKIVLTKEDEPFTATIVEDKKIKMPVAESILNTDGMEDEIDVLITKMEQELEILRKAKKILEEKRG